LKRAVLALSLLLASCGGSATNPNTPPPIQSIDLNMSKSLLVAQKAIEGDPTTVPPTIGLRDLAVTHPTFKPQINQVIAGYNLAETAYLSFHADVAAGKNPDPAAIQAQITDIVQKAIALAGSVK